MKIYRSSTICVRISRQGEINMVLTYNKNESREMCQKHVAGKTDSRGSGTISRIHFSRGTRAIIDFVKHWNTA